jgi:DNA-binding CsgD family transcriptional regulator
MTSEMSTKAFPGRNHLRRLAEDVENEQSTPMQKAPVATNLSPEGFLLLDSAMNPIFVNPAAARILVYPQDPGTQNNSGSSLANRIRLALFSEQPSNGSALVLKFQSGRRTYLCRSFRVNGMANADSQASLAVLLERASARSASLAHLSEKFHLTTREQEVAQLLIHGLTSKEIGIRMQISPNTVKAFLRLIMVKMGVSTRSAIVGKALIAEQ